MPTPTTDLAEWLAGHGLGQYGQTFIEHNIDYSVLPDLTEDDLEKLGVSLGHRKKLLRAIDEVWGTRQARDSTKVARTGAEATSPLQHRDAEFRQITVMFCDLVGSTQLSEKLTLRTCKSSSIRIAGNAIRPSCAMAARSPAISAMA